MADNSYRGYGSGNGRGRSEPSTDPLTELARLIGQSDPFGHDGHGDGRSDGRRDPRVAADWHAPSEPAQGYDSARYDDRYGAASGSSHLPQDDYGTNGSGYPAQHGDQVYADDRQAYAEDGQSHAEQGHEGHDDAHHDGYPDPRGYAGAPYPHEQAYPLEQPYPSEPNGSAYDRAPANGHPGFAPPHLADPHASRPDAFFEEAPAPRRRGWLVTAAALAALAVIGTAGAFAYRAVFAGGPPPLITRDVRPDKVMPPSQNADNAGAKQPDRLTVGDNEQMAPPPEQPINIPTAPPPSAGPSVPPAMPLAPSLPNQASAPIVQAPATAAPGPQAGPQAGPRKIRTVKITTDQEPAEPPAVPITPRPPATRAASVRTAAPPHNADAPLSLAPQGVTDTPPRAIAPGPPMRTTALAPSAAPGESAGASGYYVQVSAQKSEEEARASFHNIQARYASVLGGHRPVFRRKDLGSKGVFYGAQVGPFSHEGAIHLCEQLKTAGGSCMIQRN